jgi:hypothetical protein
MCLCSNDEFCDDEDDGRDDQGLKDDETQVGEEVAYHATTTRKQCAFETSWGRLPPFLLGFLTQTLVFLSNLTCSPTQTCDKSGLPVSRTE